MQSVAHFIAKILPLLFAFGFLVPLIMQMMLALEITPPFGLTALVFALIVGGGWGLFAQIKGRWI
ncbi:MAG: hypothetical protein AAFX04_02950 [Pseudomonadota bacterium]